MPKVVELLNAGKIRHDGLITHKFALEDVQEAFIIVKITQIKFGKLLLYSTIREINKRKFKL